MLCFDANYGYERTFNILAAKYCVLHAESERLKTKTIFLHGVFIPQHIMAATQNWFMFFILNQSTRPVNYSPDQNTLQATPP